MQVLTTKSTIKIKQETKPKLKPKLRHIFIAIFKRDLALGLRNLSELLSPIMFFLIIISLFPLGIGPDPQILKKISPGIIWVAALLATISVMDRLFRSDFEDGSLEQLMLSGAPLSILMLAKIAAHWCLTGLPLIIISPILGLMMLLTPQASLGLALILLFGTPIMSLLGAMGVSLTIGLRRASLLLSIIVLPLYIPVLIFGTQALTALINGHDFYGYLAIFTAMNLVCLVVCPLISAMAIKISMD